MAWSRGFFRLWLILSIAWMTLIVLSKGADEFKGLWQPNVKIEVEYKGVVNETLDSSRKQEDLRRQIIDGVNKGAALLQRSDPIEAKKQLDRVDQTADELLKVMVDENQKRQERLKSALILLLVPPIVLFFVGVALAWIISGFRRTA